jgi:hypothetical protein
VTSSIAIIIQQSNIISIFQFKTWALCSSLALSRIVYIFDQSSGRYLPSRAPGQDRLNLDRD